MLISGAKFLKFRLLIVISNHLENKEKQNKTRRIFLIQKIQEKNLKVKEIPRNEEKDLKNKIFA